jgi:hypothetical protein
MAGHGEQDQHEKHDDQSIHSSLNPFLQNLKAGLTPSRPAVCVPRAATTVFFPKREN